MSRDPAINLLFVGLSDGDAEQIITTFRKAGKVAHGQRVDSVDRLGSFLQKARWDLLILDDKHAATDLPHCYSILEQYQPDIPLLLLSDNPGDTPPSAFLAGTYGRHELPRLTQAAQRELLALQIRRELEEVRAALEESKQRNELLLSEHNDAVCYVTDGMIFHANPRFWEILGFEEELDGCPIVDLIDDKDQERFKNALKKQSQGDEKIQMEVGFSRDDGSELNCFLSFDNACYDGENCIQLTLQEAGESMLEGQVDTTTGFANRQHFLSQLQVFLDHERHTNGAMLMIGIDKFEHHREALGLLEVEQLAAKISERVKRAVPFRHIGRIADDIFCIIASKLPGNQALDAALALGKTIESEIFEIDRKSQQCTVSTIILPISHITQPDAPAAIKNCFSQLQNLTKQGGNQAALYTKERQQLSREDSVNTIITDAFSDKRLQLLYQPMINLSNAHGDHYEAILDIKDWRDGEVTAGEIMRVIERDPLNTKLDRWIVMEATKQLAKKRLAGNEINLILNVTGNIFHDPEFCTWLSVAMKAAGLPHSSLTLQFSEESIAQSLKPALDFSRQIRQMGVPIGVRNFCRGKEDNKFLDQIGPSMAKPGYRYTDPINVDEIRKFISRAHSLGSRIVIPNVNNASTLATLWQLGPDFIAGTYVSDPQPGMDYQFAEFS